MPFLFFNLVIIQASWLEDDAGQGGSAEGVMRERKNMRERERIVQRGRLHRILPHDQLFMGPQLSSSATLN